jgi:hypothetical protein
VIRARGKVQKGDAFEPAVGRENPRGEKPKRAWGSLLGVNNPWEAEPIHVGKKSLERRSEMETSQSKAQERKSDGKRSLDSREGSFEGKSPRALNVEKYVQGSRERRSRREGSQTLRMEPL